MRPRHQEPTVGKGGSLTQLGMAKADEVRIITMVDHQHQDHGGYLLSILHFPLPAPAPAPPTTTNRTASSSSTTTLCLAHVTDFACETTELNKQPKVDIIPNSKL